MPGCASRPRLAGRQSVLSHCRGQRRTKAVGCPSDKGAPQGLAAEDGLQAQSDCSRLSEIGIVFALRLALDLLHTSSSALLP